jgi:prepilin-type N-terminal cleavage/methylation domain-containing protein
MQCSRPSVTERGFSLVELMVAMVVTMIIAGAIYGMMAVGQNAMRREPELVDRQDNIRMAMNLIERDLAGAGMAQGTWQQVFSQNLDGASSVVGPGGALLTGGLSTNGHFNGSAAQAAKPDFLEFVAHSGTCPDVAVDCSGNGNSPCTNGSNLNLKAPLPACYGTDALVYVVWSSGGGKWGVAHNATNASGGSVNFPAGQKPNPCTATNPPMICSGGGADFSTNPPQAPPFEGQPQWIMSMALIRYEVATDADGTPCLFRSDVGGHGALGSGNYAAPPSGTWQLVARGIEDMQVVYTTLDNNAQPVYANTPPTVLENDYTTVVRDVRITLGARTLASTGARLAGQTSATNANAVVAIRGNLTRVITIPAGLMALHSIDPVGGGQKALYWK